MVNLIQQQDMLKSLADDQLQAEAASPSGSVPPFLVLTEINRRKTMRDAYSAQQARRKPSTTVAEDLLSAPMGTPGRVVMGAGAPEGGGGIGIAAALPPGAPAVPAFAEGGLVPDDVLSRISRRRLAALDDIDAGRDDLFGRSLLAAGASMMTNGSANFMKNLGAGISGGLDAWATESQVLDSREADALNGLMGVHETEQAEKLAMLDEQFRRDQEARLRSQHADELNAPTAAMRNHEYFSGLDLDEQAEFLRVNGSGAGGDVVERRYAMNAYAKVNEDTRKAVTEAYKWQLAGATTPEEKAAVEAQMEAEIKAKTDAQFTSLYPDFATLMPELTSGSPGATSTAPTAGDVQDWSTYF